uniref:NADP-dependent oxidoreductase domain-containing protein n=1 Tax=Proboscia inermis TaxID=420281 RepID=A0A7S0G9T4_9STRA|mmetsp:Transcript_23413/g.23829  ORF Transcript_23413/g.23829 Transcript_23413/m.23829 type:complete len:117 (+) Transcript_23413:1-351(+)
MDTRGWGGTLYRYRSDAAQKAIVEYAKIAEKYKMPLTELSLRWCKSRSLVTTTLVGHSNLKQLDQSIQYMTNTKDLPEDILWEIDRVHMKNRLPIFSNSEVGRDWFGSGAIGEMIP